MMDKTEIIQRLKTIVKPFVINKDAFESIDENTDFIKDLNIIQQIWLILSWMSKKLSVSKLTISRWKEC